MHSIELESIQQLQNAIRTPFLDHFFLVWNLVDSFGFAILVIGIVWYLINRQVGIRLFYILLLSFVVNTFLKTWIDLPRPCQINPQVGIICFSTPGFPSGAAQTAILLSGILFLESKNKIYHWLGLVFAAFLCFSRIYLGVHFFTDILGGLIVGGLLLIVYKKLFPLAQSHARALSFLFPIAILAIGQSQMIFQFAVSLGVATGLFLGTQAPLKQSKKTLLGSLEAICAIAGSFLLIKVAHAFPQIKALFIFASGIWFSYLSSWILFKTKNFTS